jgi:hypothetical protein
MTPDQRRELKDFSLYHEQRVRQIHLVPRDSTPVEQRYNTAACVEELNETWRESMARRRVLVKTMTACRVALTQLDRNQKKLRRLLKENDTLAARLRDAWWDKD